MHDERVRLTERLRLWKTHLENFQLPAWEELPDFGLYMDQVTALLGRYLAFMAGGETTAVSASAINNYVRLKLMPAPYRKKYSRVHLAYLIMICTLKQGMGIACIQQTLPPDLSEEDMRGLYGDYVLRHRDACRLFLRQMEEAAQDIPAPEGDAPGNAFPGLIAPAAVTAGLARMLAEELSAPAPEHEP